MSLVLPPGHELALLADIVQRMRAHPLRRSPNLRAVVTAVAHQTGLRDVRILRPRAAPRGWIIVADSAFSSDGSDNGQDAAWRQLAEAVRQSGEPAALSSGSVLPGSYASLPQGPALPPVTCLCSPILRDKEFLGVLSALRTGTAGAAQDDLDLLAVVAALIVPALEPRTERRRAEHKRPLAWVGDSPQAQDLLGLVRKVSPTQASVLLVGERGVGKARLAEIIHRASGRADRPFVRVDCGRRPDAVLMRTLFGSGSGAAGRRGAIERAAGGSLFLEHVDALPTVAQALLASLLSEGHCEIAARNATIRLDARILAATAEPLEPLARAGKFRPDLFYRLNVFPIQVASLRERRQDIPLLAHHFMKQYARAERKHVREISPGALQRIMEYDWPGNVSELEACLRRAVLQSADGLIHRWQISPSEYAARKLTTVAGDH